MAALNDVNHFREDLRSGGNDFAFLKIITFAGEVGNEGAGFTGNQCTGSDIPNLDVNLFSFEQLLSYWISKRPQAVQQRSRAAEPMRRRPQVFSIMTFMDLM